MELSVACPLCSQPGFPDVNSLWLTLIKATTRQLSCPVCQEAICGLDKLTIHLVSHSLHDQLMHACATSSFLSPPATFSKSPVLPNSFSMPPQESIEGTSSQSAPVASYVLINFPPVENASGENIIQAPCAGNVEIVGNGKSVLAMPSQDSQFPVLLNCKLEASTIAARQTTEEITRNMNNNKSEPLKFISQIEPFKNDCNSSNMLSITKETRKSCSSETVALWNQEPSSRSQFCHEGPSNSKPESVEETAMKNFSSETPGLPVSCGLCDLTFKDNTIAMLHQQLIHNLIPQADNQFSLLSKPNDRSSPKHSNLRPKRTSNISHNRDSSSSLHKFPCHVCNKVFRMRGSLMIHLRVAHCPSGTVGLTSRLAGSSLLSKYPSGDAICKLPMQNLSITERRPSFVPQQELLKTGDVYDNRVQQTLYKQTDSRHSNSSGMLKAENEQTFVSSSQLSYNDASSNKSPARTISPTLSPTQSPKGQSSSNELIATIFRCHICNKTYSKESLLTQHMKSHDSKQWECDVCFKSFTTKYFLKKHKRLHTGEMPYTCAICNKSFTFQQSYHKHLLYHSDEKPHTCNECGRAFKELSTLHNHQRIHTGEKPWACETCGKCFRQRVSYLVHRRIHTGAMPYQCTVCLKNFRYKVSQRTHKCIAPPVVETAAQSSDLLQNLLQSSANEIEVQTHGADSLSNSLIPMKEPQKLSRIQQQEMIAKQGNNHQTISDLLSNSIMLRNSTGNNSHHVNRHLKLDHDTSLVQHQSGDTNLLCSTSQLGEFCGFSSMHAHEEDIIPKLSTGSSHESHVDGNENPAPRESENVSNSSMHLAHTTPPSSSADFNIDLFQDILSMVMSPSSESTPSPSTQMRHLSLTSHNDDIESGLELRQLLYGACDSQGTP